MEDVSLDEKEGKDNPTEVKEVKEKKKVMEEVKEGVEVKEDQVLAALGNIGRWQVQIIMITGYIFLNVFWSHELLALSGVLNVTMRHYMSSGNPFAST